MPDPSIFRDMDAAAARLADAVEAREAVTIFGDYDVDGATSAALLVRLLRALDVPVRSEEHTSELQSLMRISYAVFCLKKKYIRYITNLSLVRISEHDQKLLPLDRISETLYI